MDRWEAGGSYASATPYLATKLGTLPGGGRTFRKVSPRRVPRERHPGCPNSKSRVGHLRFMGVAGRNKESEPRGPIDCPLSR